MDASFCLDVMEMLILGRRQGGVGCCAWGEAGACCLRPPDTEADGGEEGGGLACAPLGGGWCALGETSWPPMGGYVNVAINLAVLF